MNEFPVEFDFIPVYPPKEFANDPKNNIRKTAYIGEDIKRFTDAYGLQLSWPKPFDTDWIIPHTAYIYAEEKEKGIEFALEAYSSRFSTGNDIGELDELKSIATKCNLDGDELVAASQDPEYQDCLTERMSQRNKDKIFGTPFFIYQRQKYWGNDRIDWLIRHIMLDNNKPVTDLKSDPLLKIY